ncbi:hypothetical protein HDR62_04925 [bacterium]|nr:hypothetical protein [bacterium]
MKTRIWVIFCVAALLTACKESSDNMDKKLQKMERLCLEERYEEAVAFADDYWFSHPCPISDLVNGQNTLYEGLSEDEIIFRLRLASYTKTALIGSGSLVSRFFSYYRIPEIYNGMEDGAIGEYSLAGMLRQRALDNPTAVYCTGINIIEKDGVQGEVVSLMVPAMMACGQWTLAERYIYVLAGIKGWKKEALKYSEVVAFLQASSVSDEVSDDVRALAEKITAYGQKGLTDYMNDTWSLEENCRARWQQNPSSFSVLNCIIIFDMLRKNLEHAASLLPAYGQLPRPLQEMICIMQREMFPIADSVQAFLKDFPVDESVERNFRRFLHDFSLWQQGQKTAEELTAEYGHTYPYRYYLIY